MAEKCVRVLHFFHVHEGLEYKLRYSLRREHSLAAQEHAAYASAVEFVDHKVGCSAGDTLYLAEIFRKAGNYGAEVIVFGFHSITSVIVSAENAGKFTVNSHNNGGGYLYSVTKICKKAVICLTKSE